MKNLVFLVGMLISSSAFGAGDGPRVWFQSDPKVWFAATSLTGGFNSPVMSVSGHTRLKMYLTATDANSSMTSVTATCFDNITSSTTNAYAPQSCAVAAGTCTATDIVFTKAISGTKRFEFILDTSGLTYVFCTFTAGGTITASTDTLLGYYQLGSFP